MSSYNHEKYLPEAINSVLNQNFGDFELIIIDDCSQDNSRKIIEDYQKRDGRICSFFHTENMGIAKTFNNLLAKAKGKYVSFIPSDDIWVESKLEKQLAILKKNDSAIVWSEGEIIDKKSVPTGKTFTQYYSAADKKKSGDIFEVLLFQNFIFGSSVIFKREHAQNIQLDEQLKYLNDYEFYVALAKKYPFFYIEEPLAKYRIHGNNTILSHNEIWAQDNIVMRKHFLREYGNRMSKRTKAYQLLQIGGAYSFLNKKTLANFFFLQAFKTDMTMTMLNLMSDLASGKSNTGHFLVNSFKSVNFWCRSLIG